MSKERVVTWSRPFLLTMGIVLLANGVDQEDLWVSLVLFIIGSCLLDYWHRWLERSLRRRPPEEDIVDELRRRRCRGG